MGVGAEALLEGLLDGSGAVVDEVEGKVTVHANVDLDGDAVTDAPRA